MNKRVRALVLRTAGTNNDSETVTALKEAGADADLVHINRLFSREAKLREYGILVIPGGFSYGDDISAGKVFANKLKYRLGEDIEKFIGSGRIIIGICNGFQVLVKAGYLSVKTEPRGTHAKAWVVQTSRRGGTDPGITLVSNDSGKFECRWVHLKRCGGCASVLLKNIPAIIYLPVAHAEGKFVASNDKVIEKLAQNRQIVFRYTDESGNEAGYPYNPNGSMGDIAAVYNPEGNVLGMMPHPERFVTKYQHPAWRRDGTEEAFGLMIFKNAVECVRTRI